ncbi:MAG: hypothetical protein COT37_01695 [Parcubacteria group bacterium CG08_land_8_20_14_0_20_43_9]|nr:MAG: hypothetical protein COT37_01695 [Parcubacteria group bacterium CG08_land_8_20_14_0_20_43_9]
MQSKKILFLIIVFGIIAGAFLIWQFWPEDETPTPSPSPTPITVDETANWQTYSNEDYKFEMKYPENWKTDKCSKTMVFGPKETIEKLVNNGCAIGMAKELIFTINFRTTQQYEEIIVPFRKTDENKNVVLDKITVGGLEVSRYTTNYLKDASMGFKAGDIITDIIVPVESGYLEITLLDNQYMDIYNKMLKNFQFLTD